MGLLNWVKRMDPGTGNFEYRGFMLDSRRCDAREALNTNAGPSLETGFIMKNYRRPAIPRNRLAVRPIVAAVAAGLTIGLAGCGGGGANNSSAPANTGNADAASASASATLDSATRIAAAQQTATQNAQCQAVSPFYFEIGDRNGAIGSASIGGNTYTATTQMNIASASKWLFGAYVSEVRGGMLSASDVQATRMQSGYVSMNPLCLPFETVASCFAARSNDTYSPSSLGLFHYNEAHFQKWGADNGLGSKTASQLVSEYHAVLGNEIPLTFNVPLLASGAIMSADGYATFLRKILNGQLRIASLLGSAKTCTLPGACATAEYSPGTEAWNYSVGHWVEDDPITGDGTFSSAGGYGFYPWIDSSKTYYGILAREDTNLSGGGNGFASAKCGRNIRKAFMTGVVQ
jgi:hypothetical protein